jgi:hypothetical protein
MTEFVIDTQMKRVLAMMSLDSITEGSQRTWENTDVMG